MLNELQIAVERQIREHLSGGDREAVDIAVRLYGYAKAPEAHTMRGEVDQCEPWNAMLQRLHERVGKGYIACLIGKQGVGKTQMGQRAIVGSVAVGRPALYCAAYDFFQSVQSSYHRSSDQSAYKISNEHGKTKLLVVDDIRRGWSVAKHELFDALIDRRYRDRRSDTILISNMTQTAMKKLLGDRVVSRIEERGGFLECKWTSFRKRKEP